MADYVAKISARSCFDLAEFTDEYGYNVVREDFRGRGLGTKMVAERLQSQTRPAFATVRSDNAPMAKILESGGFRLAGNERPGRHGPLRLWIFRPTSHAGLTAIV
jgi:hypothetical protein